MRFLSCANSLPLVKVSWRAGHGKRADGGVSGCESADSVKAFECLLPDSDCQIHSGIHEYFKHQTILF